MEHAVKRRNKNKIYSNIIKALYSVFQAYYNNDFVKSKEFYFVVDKFKIISNITLFTFHSGTEKEFKNNIYILIKPLFYFMNFLKLFYKNFKTSKFIIKISYNIKIKRK